MSLIEPVAQLFAMTSDPRVHDVQNTLQSLLVTHDEMSVELQNVRTDIDLADSPGDFVTKFDLRVLQVNDVDLGGDLPQNSESGAQAVGDGEAAATNFAVDVTIPLEIRIPANINAGADPDADVKIGTGDVTVAATSVNVRSFEANVGVMPVDTEQSTIALNAGLQMSFDEVDDSGEITLEQLNDPFLTDAITSTQTISELAGVLPVSHSFCSFLQPDADPRLLVGAASVFDGLPATIEGNEDFNPLAVFESLTNVDIIGYLDALSTTLSEVSEALDFAEGIPFVGPALSTIIDVGTMIDEVVVQLTDGAEIYFESFQTLVDRFVDTLGVAQESLNLRCDPATNAVLMDLSLQRDYSVPVPLDFGGSLDPISVAAGFDAELFATVGLNLTIGFDFNATDQTEAEFLATPLSELNGGTGFDTIDGNDIEIILPVSTFSIADVTGHPFGLDEPDPGALDLYKQTLNFQSGGKTLKDANTNLTGVTGIDQAFFDNGFDLSNSTELSTIDLNDEWLLRDGTNLFNIRADEANSDNLIVTVSEIASLDMDSLADNATIADLFTLLESVAADGTNLVVTPITEQDLDAEANTDFVVSFSIDYANGVPNAARCLRFDLSSLR